MRHSPIALKLLIAARFHDCRSGLEWPVEPSGEYRRLEREYAARSAEPGAEPKVSLEGRIEQRARMEGSGTEPTLVVEEFVAAMPGETCQPSESWTGLTNSRWRPVRIGELNVTVADAQHEPWLVLEPSSQRLTGSGGCNRFSGSYTAGRDTLRFGRIVATMMACPDMKTESAFLRALNDTRRYRVLGRTLELLDSGGRVLARLEERNLR